MGERPDATRRDRRHRPTCRTSRVMDAEDAFASGDRRGERASLLASRSTRERDEEGHTVEGVKTRDDDVDDASVVGWRRALDTRVGRMRTLGVAFTLMCALLGVLAVITPGDGPGVGGVAALMMTAPRGVGETYEPKLGGVSSGGAAVMHAQNAPGHIPGLAEHVQSVTRATKFRAITFCNKSYWTFAHLLLESMKATSPAILDFWTIIVPDETTKKYIEQQTSSTGHLIDVYVDDDLRKQVTKYASAGKDELKAMLSWRRVHAMQTLLDHDYTVMFIEPDAVVQKNPLQLIHDQLAKNDLVVASDYGLGTSARKHANTKVMVAKPSVQGKKLFNVWQRAEQTYKGDKAETGFLRSQIIPHIDVLTAKINVLDQTVVGNYLTHHEKAAQAIVTGMGCDNVDYKINFMSQLLRHVQPKDPNNPVPAFDYEGVAMGCDHAGREKVFKISNEFAKKKLASSKLGKMKTSEARE